MAQILQIPYITTFHGNLNTWSLTSSGFWKKKIATLFFLKKILLRSFYLHFLNEGEKNEVMANLSYLKNNNFFIQENPVDFPSFKNFKQVYENQNKKKYSKNFRILFFSRINKKKGIWELLESLRILSLSKDCKHYLEIVGPCEPKLKNNLLNFIKINNLQKQVVISKPKFESIEKMKLFNSFDLFTLPSFDEGDSIAIKEALYCGMPVLITKQCKFPEDKKFPKNFVTILENNNVSNIVNNIKRINTKINFIRKNKNKCINYSKKRFSAYYFINNLKKIYTLAVCRVKNIY